MGSSNFGARVGLDNEIEQKPYHQTVHEKAVQPACPNSISTFHLQYTSNALKKTSEREGERRPSTTWDRDTATRGRISREVALQLHCTRVRSNSLIRTRSIKNGLAQRDVGTPGPDGVVDADWSCSKRSKSAKGMGSFHIRHSTR